MPTVRRNENITSWEEGDFVQGFALLSRKETRQDRNGRTYLDLELSDATGSVGAKVWPDSPAIRAQFETADFISFKGTVRSFRDQLQVNLDFCRRVREEDEEQGFDEAKLIPTTPEDIDDLFRRLSETYPGAIERPDLRRVAEACMERYGEALRLHPAAKTIHHAYRGGLLEHVVAMMELAHKVCDQYRELDRDLVLLGVLFHDLGKIREIGAMPNNDYTFEGQLVGHVTMGRDLVLECCAAAGEIDEVTRLHLEHLVLSHQGKKEYGSPVEPMTAEAFALHFIDDLDSKLNQLRIAQQSSSGMQYFRSMGRMIYLGPEKAAEAPSESETESGKENQA